MPVERHVIRFAVLIVLGMTCGCRSEDSEAFHPENTNPCQGIESQRVLIETDRSCSEMIQGIVCGVQETSVELQFDVEGVEPEEIRFFDWPEGDGAEIEREDASCLRVTHHAALPEQCVDERIVVDALVFPKEIYAWAPGCRQAAYCVLPDQDTLRVNLKCSGDGPTAP
ncbi:hypothetical protein ABI59_19715 [Acidobacteria bacterium Mor1]|nr:hypothetical protein ABI59_19715 [Acidobacteria bacterium Mor1]